MDDSLHKLGTPDEFRIAQDLSIHQAIRSVGALPEMQNRVITEEDIAKIGLFSQRKPTDVRTLSRDELRFMLYWIEDKEARLARQ